MNTEEKDVAGSAVAGLKPERVQDGVVAPPPEKKKSKARPSSFADVLRDWESLLGAVDEQTPNRVGIEPHRAALALTLEKARAAKLVQETHDASRQSTTQSLQEILVEGKDQAIRLRGAVRAELGPTTEQLKQFGIPPLRRRPLRRKSAPLPQQQPEIVARPPVPPVPAAPAMPQTTKGTE